MVTNKKTLETQYKGKCLESRNLPALPLPLREAMALMNSPNASMQKVAVVISRDQVLSAKVLKMVNSPIYGFPGRISSIQNALVLLGFNVIRGLIISTVVFDTMSKSMKALWAHSLSCSVLCREIAKVFKVKDLEECTLAGLLHDFGKIITATQMPEAQKELEKLVAEKDILFYNAEKELLGFSHTQINGWVAEHWSLPPSLKAAMMYHHNPMGSAEHKTLCCVVHLSDFLARLYESGSGGDNNVPVLDPMALKHLGLDQSALGDLVDKAGETLASMGDSPLLPE